MTLQKLNKDYWDNKFTSYMHDPFDKALDIKGHVERANTILESYGLSLPNNEFWKKADGIASGFERGQITGYKRDESSSGSVDFLKSPIITHPIGKESPLKIDLKSITHAGVWDDLKDYLSKKIGNQPGVGYSDKFKNNPAKFAEARFFYTHLALRFNLASDNVGDLGALWHRLPADTRFPDHSIWQHNALVSAIQSCFELAENNDDLGIMLFSITPVQGFIERARKLRDYWTGSLLLSWLAFEGIRWVMENLGPDHILYPSLIDQPLVNEYLKQTWKIDEDLNFLNQSSDIASFPNKFLFLTPFKDNLTLEISKEIENHILKKWNHLNDLIIEKLPSGLKNSSVVKDIFKRQNEHLWDIQWVSVKLLEKNDRHQIAKLLPEKNFKNQFDLLDKFLAMIKDKAYYEKSGKGVLYSTSHSLCQSALAVRKTQKKIKRKPEPGEKCCMCGEFEVLHDVTYDANMSANDYKKSVDAFWEHLRKDKNDFNENEKLCSVCLTKRIAYRALKADNDHILRKAFKNAENFPSTTYISLYNFFKRKNISKEEEKIKISQEMHDTENIKVSKDIRDKDKYYAILLMDGDHMGKLVNGETIASTWESIMHPNIVEKIKNNKLDGDYNRLWQEIYNDKNISKRLLTPSIHAAISESLGDFALYGVTPIIKKYVGKLVYAGGDDVCAILPIDNALSAASEIKDYYSSAFRLIKRQNNAVVSDNINTDNGKWSPEQGKLSVNVGKGDSLTISAGILICHHKENLSEMIKRTHKILDERAKEEGGRNAVAVELRKRSGGSRYFVSKWNDERLKAFEDLIVKIKISEDLSRSLAYRFAEFKNGIEAILAEEEYGDLLEKFVLSQLKKSGVKTTNEKQKESSEAIGKIILDNNKKFSNEGLIIAGFLAK